MVLINPHYKKEPPEDKLPWDYWITVPCNRCSECRKSRGREWKIRLAHEHMYGNHRNVLFVTLSFSPRYYKQFKDSPQLAVRRFLERYRKKYKKSLCHWFITELGEEKGRLHIHGLIWDARFFIPLNKKQSIKRVNHQLRYFWKYGNTWIGYFDDARTLNYLVKYLTKAPEYDPSFIGRIFVTPGLGRDFINSDSIQSHYWSLKDVSFYKVPYYDRELPMPRYYLRCLFGDDYLRQMSYERFINSPPFCSYLRGVKYLDEERYKIARLNLFQKDLESGFVKEVCYYELPLPELFLIHNLYKGDYSDENYRTLQKIEKIYPYLLFNYGYASSATYKAYKTNE